MKIVPSEDLKKHLMEQNVKNPEGGFDVYDVPEFEYEAEKLLLLPSHIGESAEAFEDRLQYRLIWKLYGVPVSGSQKGVDLTAIQRIEAMRREVAEVVEKHLPNVSADISKAMNLGHEKVVEALSALKTFEGESHAEVIKIKSELHADMMEVAKRGIKIMAGMLGIIAALIVLLCLLSGRSHAQIDVIKFQDSSGTTLGVAAAPFTLKVASGCTWSRSGSIWTIGCSTGTVTNNPGSPSTSVQYNCSGAFCGIPEVHLGAVLIDQGPGVAPAFADPLVQGLVAAGSTSLPNPVVMGGSDYGGTAAVRTAKVDASGNVSVTPTATPNPSNLDVAASTLAKETGGNLAAIKSDVDKIPALGQALAAASMPVVLPAAQITTLTPPAAITNFANETGGNLAAIKADVDKIPALGQALAAGSVPVVLTAAQISTLTPLGTVGSTVADGANATLGAKADAKSSATDTTAISAMQVLKEISFLLQNTLVVNGSGVTQPVSGPLTDTQLRASAVPVSLASAPTTAVTNQGLTDLDAAIAAVGSAVPANAMAIGGTDGTNLVRFYVDPCQRGAHTTQLINLTASATLITGTSAKNVYICDINIMSTSADNVALVEGTGTVCATGIAGMAGGTTAATGWPFAANGGLTLGNGAASILNTATAADNVCILVSGATQVSGSFHYVKF